MRINKLEDSIKEYEALMEQSLALTSKLRDAKARMEILIDDTVNSRNCPNCGGTLTYTLKGLTHVGDPCLLSLRCNKCGLSTPESDKIAEVFWWWKSLETLYKNKRKAK